MATTLNFLSGYQFKLQIPVKLTKLGVGITRLYVKIIRICQRNRNFIIHRRTVERSHPK